VRPSTREPNNGSARFSPSPQRGERTVRYGPVHGSQTTAQRGFTLSAKGRGDCPVRPSAREPNNGSARFSPSPQRGEGTVRCGPVHGSQTTAQRGFHSLPKGARGLSGTAQCTGAKQRLSAVFTLSPKGRGDCPVRPSARELNNGSARFSPSPLWGEGRGEGQIKCACAA